MKTSNSYADAMQKNHSLGLISLKSPSMDRRSVLIVAWRKTIWERIMNTICRRGIAAAFSFAIGFGVPAAASAQQQAPDAQVQQNAPAQQATPAKPGPGMGMMRDGMDHGKMGRKGMEGDHGRMGAGMNQGSPSPSTDSTTTTGAGPSTNSNTTPSTGSK